jgi:hypothetical protein
MLNISHTAVAAASLMLLFRGVAGPPALGGERHVLFTNETRQPIVELHVSRVGSGDWQLDLLGSEYLPPGDAVAVTIDDPNESCRVDFKMVLDNGSELVSRGIDICRDEIYALSRR